jgi:hypothetical protein
MQGLVVSTFVAVPQAMEARREATKLQASVDLLNAVFKAADVNSGRGGKRSLVDLLDVAANDVVMRRPRARAFAATRCIAPWCVGAHPRPICAASMTANAT